jgi:hypothetical protein
VYLSATELSMPQRFSVCNAHQIKLDMFRKFDIFILQVSAIKQCKKKKTPFPVSFQIFTKVLQFFIIAQEYK